MDTLPIFAEAQSRGYTGESSDFFALADFFQTVGEPTLAALVLEQAVGEFPRHGKLRLRLALLYRKMGNRELALPHLYHIFESSPEDRTAIEYLLWTGIECGRADVVCDVADSYCDGRYDSLVDELRSRIQAQPEDSTLRFSLAWILLRRGLYRAAVDGFGELLGDPRWGPWAQNLLGVCYRERAIPDLNLAVHHFQKAVASALSMSF